MLYVTIGVEWWPWFLFSSRRRHTRCALVTGVQTCALPISRWPKQESVKDWSQGAPLEKVRALCAHWADRYDWRRCEAMLNAFGQYRTTLDGLDIQFLHVRSPEPDALPLLITHGWPGSEIGRAHV